LSFFSRHQQRKMFRLIFAEKFDKGLKGKEKVFIT
jgi:hypothetical protein